MSKHKRPWDGTIEDAKLLHEGRRIQDSKSADYIGGPDFAAHLQQLRDPNSWVHSSVLSWRRSFEPTEEERQADEITVLRERVKELEAQLRVQNEV